MTWSYTTTHEQGGRISLFIKGGGTQGNRKLALKDVHDLSRVSAPVNESIGAEPWTAGSRQSQAMAQVLFEHTFRVSGSWVHQLPIGHPPAGQPLDLWDSLHWMASSGVWKSPMGRHRLGCLNGDGLLWISLFWDGFLIHCRRLFGNLEPSISKRERPQPWSNGKASLP